MNQPLQNVRHRLATERNRLIADLANLKPGSSIAKIVRGKLMMANEAIEICDQELLALEQGASQETGSIVCDGSFGIQNWGKLRPDQLAWLGKRRGE